MKLELVAVNVEGMEQQLKLIRAEPRGQKLKSFLTAATEEIIITNDMLAQWKRASTSGTKRLEAQLAAVRKDFQSHVASDIFGVTSSQVVAFKRDALGAIDQIEEAASALGEM
eukprot:GHVO01052712.1.p1 GENE.GHVO01052712.1~~GHVO01052712.1.p1  ORF type:complete len:113 (-),score=23.36 GHVO01052712.1:359-697(-)